VTDSNGHAIRTEYSVLQRLLGPEAPELSCEQCFELLDQYVELEFEDLSADLAIPGMQAHLEGCSACREEHDSLLALVTDDRRDRQA
jgi:hypothetical protein